MTKELSDETKNLLKQIVDHFDDEDRGVRDRQIREWRKLKLMWENLQHTYYSEVAHDWRVPQNDSDSGNDQGFYDKPVNIYRAYLESIIAALSVTVPPITCYPDDADNPLDVVTAKAGNKIAELIFRHNDAPLFWLHALFVFCTEGMTACYTYPKEDESYGTYEEKKYEDSLETHEITTCPICGTEMSDEIVSNEQRDQFMPGDADAIANDILMNEGMDYCATCAQMVSPSRQTSTLTITKLTGITTKPKSRICMEVYGGLFVKIPVWARTQSECAYLIYSYETHFSNVLEQYPDLRDKIVKQGSSNYDLYEQWGRTSPQYRGEHPINNVTVRNCWLRPSAFNVCGDEDEVKQLKKQFPDGCKVVVVNDQVAYACNENLDDCWTLTYNPLSDYIHFDPLGLLLTSVQDITNDLISLVLQTVEHGIPQTFADPKVLNFNAYRNSEVIPGGIYPATPKSGKPLSEGFYEVKTATLSQEVLPFAQKVQEIGQLVCGALPSLFGGQMAGSRTASEYSMSRAQALQRLQTTWKMLTMWWKQIFSKVIPMYIKEMKDDEKQVKRDEFGNFVNIFIRMSEIQGKIGQVELEANENLPITWNQQKDTIMELFKMQSDPITMMLMTPENIALIKKAVGLNDFVIPDGDDKQKEYEEIQLLISSEPIEMPPDPMMMEQAFQMGMPPPPPIRTPSIVPDFDVDNHVVAADIDRRWCVSDAGRLCKMENPAGYENVLLHMKMHKDMNLQFQMQEMQKQMMAQGGMMPPQQQAEGGTEGSTGQPLNEGQNEPTVQ
jgi:hypothetical protein